MLHSINTETLAATAFTIDCDKTVLAESGGMRQLFGGMHVLVVDDDEIVREIVATFLQSLGFHATATESLAAALLAYRRQRFDLLVVDVNLPDGLGFDLVKTLREHRDVAVIYLTSRGNIADRIRGLDAGGDDYLVKPVDLDELAARTNAVLRRYHRPRAPSSRLIALPDWTLDLVRRELADRTGHLVPLTRGEFDLFSALVQASPTALDREYLLEVVSSADATAGVRTIDVMISRIRTKLAAAPIQSLCVTTIRGTGYRFDSACP